MGWRATLVVLLGVVSGEAAAQDAPRPVLLLRICDDLHPSIHDAVALRVPEVLVVGTDLGGRLDWQADLCLGVDGAVSVLTNLHTGATDTARAPIAAGIEAEALGRLLGNLLHLQLAAVWGPEEHSAPSEPTPPADLPASAEPEVPELLSMRFGVAFLAGGRLSPGTGSSATTLGAQIAADFVIRENWFIGISAAPSSLLCDDEDTQISVVPLALEAGVAFEVGPMDLGVALLGIAESWTPSGRPAGAGWRGGIGIAGTWSMPVWEFFELWAELGVNFFPRSKVFQVDRDFVAELPNWRWQGLLGISVRIPLL